MIDKIKKHISEFGLFDTIIWIFRTIGIKIQKTRIKNKDFYKIDYRGCEEYLTKKNNHNIFIITKKSYCECEGRLRYLAKLYNDNGHNVIYIYVDKINEQKRSVELPLSMQLELDSNSIKIIEKLIKSDDVLIVDNSLSEEILSEFVKKSKAKIIYEDNDGSIEFSEDEIGKYLDLLHGEKKASIFKDKLSVIVLNYNNKNIIFDSIDSLLKYNELYNYEIIVVDNGSIDGSYEILKKEYSKKIKLIRNSRNGCSSGRNIGVKESNRDYILFLDSDQIATNKYWLHSFEDIMLTCKNVGAIGWAAGFLNSKGYSYTTVDNFPYRFMPSDSLARNDVSYLGSGGMLMKRDLFLKIGGFDENYDPTCYEDTDLSLNIRDNGYEIYYSPYLGIIHFPHQTTNEGSKKHTELMHRNREYFKNKWVKKNKLLLKKFRK